MILPEDQMNFAPRLRFLTDVTVLEFLCSPEAVTRLESAVESLNTRDERNSLRGYRLAAATPLYGLLQFTVNFPEMLGLENDDGLFNWLHYRSPERGESLLHAVSDPASGLGRLCYIFDELHTALRRAEGSLIDTVDAINGCRGIAEAFRGVLEGTRIVSLDTGEELPGRASLVRLSVAERVLDYIEYDRSIVPLAHRMVWRSKEEFRPVDSRFVLDAEIDLPPENWSMDTWNPPEAKSGGKDARQQVHGGAGHRGLAGGGRGVTNGRGVAAGTGSPRRPSSIGRRASRG